VSIPLMGLVWTSTMRDATEVAVLSCLASHANDEGESCFAGIPRIARIVRRSERTVQRTIEDLEKAGWLLVLRGDGAGNFTRYEIVVEQLKGCQDVTLLRRSKRVTSVQERVTLAPEKGDIGDSTILKETLEETKANKTPPNPPQAGERVIEIPTPALDRGADQVMCALGLAKPRLRKRIRAVIALEAEKGEPPPTIALDMIAAWREQARLGHLLHRKYGIMNFFELGIWKDKNSWLWNEELLRQRAQASVGSYQ
jgi:hypothetical protein